MEPEEFKRLLTLITEGYEDPSMKEREEIRAIVEAGIAQNIEYALHFKAYACYGGNQYYPCDWKMSEECLLKLVELTGNADYYNTLGYIYYYGRCNDGVPEYDKAFQYFSVGAACGVYESIYKLADMFLAGNGCLKNPEAGANLILSLYRENYDIFCDGVFDGKFADIALRVGGLLERGDGVPQNIEEAYGYYLEARLAIDKRTAEYKVFGDGKVKDKIYEAINRVLPQIPADFYREYQTLDAPGPIGLLLSHSVGLDIKVEWVRGYYRIFAKSYASEEVKGLALINVPEVGYCELTDHVCLYLSKDAEVLTKMEDVVFSAFITDIIPGEQENVWKFMCRDMVLFAVKCSEFYFYKQD